jgi:hypothetical protein
MLGYLGLAQIGGTTFLFTGGGINKTRNRMDSSAAFGGQTATGGVVGMGVPHQFDYPQYEGSLDFELDDGNTLLALFQTWITQRNQSRAVVIKPNNASENTFDGYWTSLSFSGGVGSLVTGSVGLTALTATMAAGETYPVPPAAGGIVNPVIFTQKPMAFWRTKVRVGVDLDVLTWSLNFNQDVVKVFTCQGQSTPQEPKYVAVGPLTGDFQCEVLQTAALPSDTATPILTLATRTFTFTNAELNSTGQSLKSGSDVLSFPMQYQLYGYTFV